MSIYASRGGAAFKDSTCELVITGVNKKTEYSL